MSDIVGPVNAPVACLEQVSAPECTTWAMAGLGGAATAWLDIWGCPCECCKTACPEQVGSNDRRGRMLGVFGGASGAAHVPRAEPRMPQRHHIWERSANLLTGTALTWSARGLHLGLCTGSESFGQQFFLPQSLHHPVAGEGAEREPNN